MNFKKLNTIARRVLSMRTYADRAKYMKMQAYKAGNVKKVGTYGYYFMKLSRVFLYYDEHTTGITRDAFSIFSNENTKLKYKNFSTLPGHTCPGAGKCLDFCYSFKAWRNPSVFCRQLMNSVLLIDRKAVIAEAFKQLKNDTIVRLYVDGDIDSIQTLSFWFGLLSKRPSILAFGYSKSWEVFLTYANQKLPFPGNYVLNISGGSKYDSNDDMREQMLALPITRHVFDAVDTSGNYSKGFKRYDDAEYHREVRAKLKQKYPGQNVFSCTGKCHDCISVKGRNMPACSLIDLKLPIGNGTH